MLDAEEHYGAAGCCTRSVHACEADGTYMMMHVVYLLKQMRLTVQQWDVARAQDRTAYNPDEWC
jgi:hypothetical protein